MFKEDITQRAIVILRAIFLILSVTGVVLIIFEIKSEHKEYLLQEDFNLRISMR